MIFRQRTRKRKRKVKGAREKLSDTPLHVDIQSLPLERALLKLRVVSELKLRFLEAVLHPTLDVDARVARQPRLRARVHGAERTEARRVERVLDGEDVHVVVAHVVAPRVQHAQRPRELPLQRLVHRAQAHPCHVHVELPARVAVQRRLRVVRELRVLRVLVPRRRTVAPPRHLAHLLVLGRLGRLAPAPCRTYRRHRRHGGHNTEGHGPDPHGHRRVVVVTLRLRVDQRGVVVFSGNPRLRPRHPPRRHAGGVRCRRRLATQLVLAVARRLLDERARPRGRQHPRRRLAPRHDGGCALRIREARNPRAARVGAGRHDAERRRRRPLAQPRVDAAQRQHAAGLDRDVVRVRRRSHTALEPERQGAESTPLCAQRAQVRELRRAVDGHGPQLGREHLHGDAAALRVAEVSGVDEAGERVEGGAVRPPPAAGLLVRSDPGLLEACSLQLVQEVGRGGVGPRGRHVAARVEAAAHGLGVVPAGRGGGFADALRRVQPAGGALDVAGGRRRGGDAEEQQGTGQHCCVCLSVWGGGVFSSSRRKKNNTKYHNEVQIL
eukprot:Rhum_TRINITY_DN14670_c5_g1::Rhum_TRINITY_DN14670_c5_g1_i4::g.108294::m.108294